MGAPVPCSPCEHGKELLILAAPPGSTVWSPTCLNSKGLMRPHEVKPPESKS